MTPYQRGRAFEYQVRDHLRRAGYFVVRSASSKGPCDLVAVSSDSAPLLVQCKHGVHPALPPDEWNALYDAATSIRAIPLLATSRRRHLVFVRLIARKDGTRTRGTTLSAPFAIAPLAIVARETAKLAKLSASPYVSEQPKVASEQTADQTANHRTAARGEKSQDLPGAP